MTDADTSAAIEALTHRFKTRDQAIRDGEDHPDAEVVALEFMTALRGQGWRPTAARSAAPPPHAPAGTATAPRDEILRDLRADMEARAARDRAAREAGAA